MMTKHKTSVPIDFFSNSLIKIIKERFLSVRYSNKSIDNHIGKLCNCSDAKLNKVFKLVFTGQSRAIYDCFNEGEDVRLIGLGSFKQKEYRKFFAESENEVLRERNLSKDDINDSEVLKDVREEAKTRANAKIKIHKSKVTPKVINFDIFNC